MPSNPTATPSSEDEPIQVELELVRAEAADDAFAFRFARQTYLVRGRQGAYETTELPWSRELLRDLEEVRLPDRDPATVARVGDLLRELLDPAGWPLHEAAIVDARAARRRVHVTIRSAAAELYALPWELLTLRADGQHLGALDHVLLRYAWPGTSTVAAGSEATEGPGRVLLAWSAAGGGIPAADQIKAIEQAAHAAGRDDAVEVLPNASYGAIADALDAATSAGRPFRALHLLSHGAEVGSTFGLSLDAEGSGRPAVIDAGRLQQLLAPHAHALRLVVVAACDGGNMGQPGNRIGSVAQRLHRAGLQYVIASRYPLSARGSTRMAGALYQALLRGESVERAFVDARAAASREVSQLDWASLQLYARAEDGDHGCVLVPPVAPAHAPVAPPASTPAPVAEAEALPPPAEAPTPAPNTRSWTSTITLVIVTVLVTFSLLVVFFVVWAMGDDQLHADDSAAIELAPDPNTAPASLEEGDTYYDDDDAHATYYDDAHATYYDDTYDTYYDDDGHTEDDDTEPKPVTIKPKPKPKNTRPVDRCSRDLKEHIDDRIGSPGGGAYDVEIWARADGSVVLEKCAGCNDVADKAKAGLKTVKASTLTKTWKDELPCRITYSWQ